MEIEKWAKKRFQGILESPENASRDQAMAPIRLKLHLKNINERIRL